MPVEQSLLYLEKKPKKKTDPGDVPNSLGGFRSIFETQFLYPQEKLTLRRTLPLDIER